MHARLIGSAQDSWDLREEMRRERLILKQFIAAAQDGMQSIQNQLSGTQPGQGPTMTRAEFNKLSREFDSLNDKYGKVLQDAERQERIHELPDRESGSGDDESIFPGPLPGSGAQGRVVANGVQLYHSGHNQTWCTWTRLNQLELQYPQHWFDSLQPFVLIV